jgi:hypothetical protein
MENIKDSTTSKLRWLLTIGFFCHSIFFFTIGTYLYDLDSIVNNEIYSSCNVIQKNISTINLNQFMIILKIHCPKRHDLILNMPCESSLECALTGTYEKNLIVPECYDFYVDTIINSTSTNCKEPITHLGTNLTFTYLFFALFFYLLSITALIFTLESLFNNPESYNSCCFCNLFCCKKQKIKNVE